MKKNIFLFLSMFLILSMFISMFYVAVTGKNENAIESKNNEDLEQELRINLKFEPKTLHPGLATDTTSNTVLPQLFEGLSRIDQWGQRVNGMAKTIKISDDQKTYTFILRDAKWTNGDPVIAKDFEFAWKWVLNPANNSANAHQFYLIKGAQLYHEGTGSKDDVSIRAIDEKTLVVELNEPSLNFLELTALNAFYPVNSKIVQKHPNWAKDAKEFYTSNGPYQITEWTHNNRIILKKNNHYWDAGSVKLKNISMTMLNDPKEEIALYEKGEFDWIQTRKEQGTSVEDLLEDKDFYSTTQAGIYAYQLNTNAKLINNINFRKALALAINRKQLLSMIDQKGSVPALAIVPPFLDPKNKDGYFKDNDLTKAKTYLESSLAELGYQNVSDLPPFTLTVSANKRDKLIAQTIKDMWEKNLGVKVNMEAIGSEVQNNVVKDSEYEVSQFDWINSLNDSISILEVLQNSHVVNSGESNWDSDQFVSYLTKSNVETDGDKRKSQLRKAESVLMKEMIIIPIFYYPVYYMTSPELQDVSMSEFGQVQFKWAYFK